MISISATKYQEAIDKHRDEFDEYQAQILSDLEEFRASPTESFTCFESLYLDLLILHLTDIIFAPPRMLDEIKTYWGELPEESRKKVGNRESFKDRLLKKLKYTELRSKFYPKLFSGLGVKTCVYCNTSLAVVVDRENDDGTIELSAKFELDHFVGKSKYPALGISFYNLYPVCRSCNLAKGEKDVAFELYSDDYYTVRYSSKHFRITEASLLKYLNTKNADVLEIEFFEDFYNPGEGPFQRNFQIQGIYNTQKDVAEELILKSTIYNSAYKKQLLNTFPRIFSNSSITNRLLIGNYGEETEIHKRPMSKFTMDIARQLGLIK